MKQLTKESLKQFLDQRPAITARGLCLHAGINANAINQLYCNNRNLTAEMSRKLITVMVLYGYDDESGYDVPFPANKKQIAEWLDTLDTSTMDNPFITPTRKKSIAELVSDLNTLKYLPPTEENFTTPSSGKTE